MSAGAAAARTPAAHPPPVAILCGQGEFPLRAAQSVVAAGRPVLLVGIRGVAGPGIEAFPHVWFGLGELGGFLEALRQRGIRHLAIAGGMTRPAFSDLRLDFGGLKKLPEIAGLFLGGDNHLLAGFLKILEREGLTIVGVQEIAPGLLAPSGLVTQAAPGKDARQDIGLGRAFIAAASPFDVGQAVIVHAGRVLAVEAAEGTDAMIARVTQMRREGRLRLKGRAGVLVKAPKRGQDLRIDLPAVGPRTIALCAEAELEGLSLAAGQVLMLDRADLAAQADRAGLFLHGHDPAAGGQA